MARKCQNITTKEPAMANKMDPARPSHDFFGEIRGLSLCLPSHAPANRPPVSLSAGMKTSMMACATGMTVERQRHDQAGGKQRNVQNGEHGDCHMAQSAVAHFTLFMIERRFETSTCIGVRQFVRHGQGKPTAERHLALAAIATSSKEASTQTVIATI